MNLLVAGRDSIASSLCWFLYCMCIHQDKQERVFQELLSIERKLEYNPKRTNSNQLYLFQEYADFLTYEDVHDDDTCVQSKNISTPVQQPSEKIYSCL